jgi:hypothetical protein
MNHEGGVGLLSERCKRLQANWGHTITILSRLRSKAALNHTRSHQIGREISIRETPSVGPEGLFLAHLRPSAEGSYPHLTGRSGRSANFTA